MWQFSFVFLNTILWFQAFLNLFKKQVEGMTLSKYGKTKRNLDFSNCLLRSKRYV